MRGQNRRQLQEERRARAEFFLREKNKTRPANAKEWDRSLVCGTVTKASVECRMENRLLGRTQPSSLV